MIFLSIIVFADVQPFMRKIKLNKIYEYRLITRFENLFKTGKYLSIFPIESR